MAFRSASTPVVLSATSGAIGKPAGTAEGDLLVAIIDVDLHPEFECSGFTSRILQSIDYDGETFQILTKQAGSSEPSSYTFTPTVGGDWNTLGVGVLLCFSGYTGGSLVLGTPGVSNSGNTSPFNAAAPAITIPSGTYDLLAAAGLDQSGDETWSATAPSGMDERVDFGASGQYSGIAAATLDALSAGDTGSKTFAFSGGASGAGWAAVLIGIPVSGGGSSLVVNPLTGRGGAAAQPLAA